MKRFMSQILMGEFQFPSNGKAYTKRKGEVAKCCITTVSIPFKREGIYKDGCAGVKVLADQQFQFPSNGKAYTK